MHSRLSVLMPQCWWEVLQGLLIQNPTHQDHNNAQIQCSPGAEWFSLQESGFIPSFLVINQPTNLHPRPPLDETWTLVDQSLRGTGFLHEYWAEGYGSRPGSDGSQAQCGAAVWSQLIPRWSWVGAKGSPINPICTLLDCGRGWVPVPVDSHLDMWDLTITR